MDPIKKIGTLFRSFVLQAKAGIVKASPRGFKGSTPLTKRNIVRALVLGTLMSMAVALPLIMVEGGADADAREKNHTFSMVDVRHYENHEGWEDGEAFEARGTSTLVRSEERVIGTFQTSGFEPGAWTMWWIFYNHPDKCQNPLFDPEGNQLSQCSGKDRAIPEVGRSPGWGGSSVVGEDGIGNFAAVKDVGMGAAGSPRDVNLCCPIVTNPMGAEVHILMRYHGPVEEDDAELLLDQLYTWGGGCDYDPSLNRGMPGDFDCVDPAMSVHPSPMHDFDDHNDDDDDDDDDDD